MIPQPETRPISQEQLVAEVKGIYAGLVMVESKCIEVDTAQSTQAESTAKLNNEQWQALIALHRTLLHEHHDFFLASQHPSASPALRRLSQKYAMPARMWRHGIHSFLELLRSRLPASLEHMLTFIYLAYSMMALLYETVPSFEDTWIECLGDLGRYRMAIEDEDIRDREIWTGVSRHWYAKASDRAPTTGRLYHHLAILSRPNAYQQLFYYSKSLCVAYPFKSARDSILTLFDPILNNNQHQLPLLEFTFVKSHAILFIDQMMADYNTTKTEFIARLDPTISRCAKGWNTIGGQIAISNNNAILEYGKTDANAQGDKNVILAALTLKTGSAGGDVPMDGSEADSAETDGEPVPSEMFGIIQDFVKDCDQVMFNRYGDNNIMSYLHVRLAYMYHMAQNESAMKHLEDRFPWAQVTRLLNLLVVDAQDLERTESEEFPRPTERPLPEDWTMRGHLWVEGLYPDDWFNSDKFEEDEKVFELPSMREHRRTRVLWFGRRLASFRKWIIYDKESKQYQCSYVLSHQAGCLVHGSLPKTLPRIARASTTDSTATMTDEMADSEPEDFTKSEAEDASSMVVEGDD
ncbi:hypothetical protein M406DRAFT_273063 [Cryphonectria parasitica EP155]|uniref:DNA/RNA-binding domain-containing protein n=1 Tax=Cryphonectria parasitica (strain ATCC 38755 / EP155) TaxID=660469 RepID=A0A9P4Y956_CRYP1|nr:uncharacterized protein M406DRAFT_273063 [Cryphonectria parasitica EP155]KAF3768627.1 hypothetical protein M406DRAFT_273063 [Cryphonectria parasitica EP155]